MNFTITSKSDNANVYIEKEYEADGVTFIDIKAEFKAGQVPESFTLKWKHPVVDCYSTWTPNFNNNSSMRPNWGENITSSRLAYMMPIHQINSVSGKNRLCIALSDAVTPTSISTGVCEEDAFFDCKISFFTIPAAPMRNYSVTVRIDTRNIDYYDCLYDVSSWWENSCGYKPLNVPEHARLPMNSLWYSYHQMLDIEDILKECRLSKPLGMDTVIIDDGWHTDDNNRGFAFCGDWKLATSKIPDMADFVQKIHDTGMKVMLWYSVPLIGIKSKNYEAYKDMLLDQTGNCKDYWALDPRYKEVRDFLTSVYEKAVSEWKLDGLKLDFIDSFVLRGKSLEHDDRRDYVSLEDAIDVLMMDITERLKRINPDILIEFRQCYVGPAIRKYGNMFRVADCPNDPITNRINIVNLRYTSGKTAVHSDMLMWNYSDTKEAVGIQLANILYSVPQISVKIDKLSEEHKKVLAFYLNLWRKNRATLLDGKLIGDNPESNYSKVTAKTCKNAVVTCYTNFICDCKDYENSVIVNASMNECVYIKNAAGKSYCTYNCMGEKTSEGKVSSNLHEITVQPAGVIYIN